MMAHKAKDIGHSSKLRAALNKALEKWKSQSALAEHLGITDAYLSELLSGKKKGERRLIEIADKLGISPLDLLETSHAITHDLSYLDGIRKIRPISPAEFMAGYGTKYEVHPPRRPHNVGEGPTMDEATRRVTIRLGGDEYLPKYRAGDELVVDPGVEPRINDICMVIIGEKLLFRRLLERGMDEIRFCLPHDENQQEVIKSGSSVRPDIWGRVTGVWRNE